MLELIIEQKNLPQILFLPDVKWESLSTHPLPTVNVFFNFISYIMDSI